MLRHILPTVFASGKSCPHSVRSGSGSNSLVERSVVCNPNECVCYRTSKLTRALLLATDVITLLLDFSLPALSWDKQRSRSLRRRCREQTISHDSTVGFSPEYLLVDLAKPCGGDVQIFLPIFQVFFCSVGPIFRHYMEYYRLSPHGVPSLLWVI